MKLTSGQKAPQFNVNDTFGNSIRLESFKGKKLLVSFFRDVTCPFCNLRIRDLLKKREDLEKEGLNMVFFFESSSEQLNNSRFHQKASPIPLVGDPEMNIYKKFGVEKSMAKVLKTLVQSGTFSAKKEGESLGAPTKKENHTSMGLIPADFLIDENLVVKEAYYGSHVRDHLPTTAIISFARG